MKINYCTNDYKDAFKEIARFNKYINGLPRNIKPYLNHRTFKSIYRIYVFDTRYQNDHIGPQPIQLHLKFAVAVADVICHALLLTRRIVIVKNNGNEKLDIVSLL